MAINFPNSPNNGDIYTVSGKQWIYEDGKWATYGLAIAPDTLKVDSVNNRVGVNNLTPAVDLDVTGNAAVSGNLTVDGNITVSGDTTTLNTTELYVEDNKITLNSGATGSATANAGIEVERGDDANVEILWDETADAWKIATDFTVDTSTFHVDSTNNRVGIGTTSPSTALEVSSDTGGGTTSTDLRISSTGQSSTWSTSNAWGVLDFYNADGSGGGAKSHVSLQAVAGESLGQYSDLQFHVTDGSASDITAMTIEGSSGNVGIGTTSPENVLHVTQSGFVPSTNDDASIRVDGNWGGGIVFSESTNRSMIYSPNGNAFRVRVGATSSGGGTEALNIDSSGNVGINDTTPSYKLDVNGDINATGDVRVAGAPVGKVLVYEGSVGSGVSSFTASNVFSSAYDNYEVIVSGMDCSIDGVVLGLRLGSSTTAYYYGGYYIIYSSGASGFFSSTVESSWGVGYTDTRGVTGFVAQILCPNLAIRTKFTAVSPGNNVQRSVAGEHSSNTAHTSFTLLPSSGTMTGGVVRVYGHVEA